MRPVLSLSEIAHFIFSAIEGKYASVDHEYVENCVAELSAAFQAHGDMAKIRKLVSECNSADRDITNQFVVLTLLDHDVGYFLSDGRPVKCLFEHVYGTTAQVGKRSQATVEDYGHEPINPLEVEPRLDELERLLVSVCSLETLDAMPAAKVLAFTFSRIIEIHYFSDGNGRVARFVIQLMLRCWNRPLMPLPKVRNDAVWKSAVAASVSGDLRPLEQEFRRRLLT
jgi:hypothetical protein